MATFIYAVMSIANAASMHCAVRPEISPCTCDTLAPNHMALSCEKVDSFHQIVTVLSNKFLPDINIHLKITHSELEDLEMRLFKDMNMNIVKLRMQWNKMRSVPELPFRGLSNVEYLSFGDNLLEEIPKHALTHMPMIKTLDIARCRIRSVLQDDFKGTQLVTYLFLPDNNITRLDKGVFPPGLITLHLGRNQLESLNGTLRYLSKLESLFINANSLTTLEGELPEYNCLKLLMAHNNRLERLPESMRHMVRLETVHLQYNCLKSLDRTFQNASILNELFASNNEIAYLSRDEFLACDCLENLDMAMNRIKYLNSSLLPLVRLRDANFSFNEMEEFSMWEINGLRSLRLLDLTNNRIERLTGHIEGRSNLLDLRLSHNRIKHLDGALIGLNSLSTLRLAYNDLERILPHNFQGLEKLETLDLSHNNLSTLEDMERAFLPKLSTLMVEHNNLTHLKRDFHGFPVLCFVNLTNNRIEAISDELIANTRCQKHGVADKLQLHLDNNPIMCDAQLKELCVNFVKQEARIRGRSECFESDKEICTVMPMLFTTYEIPTMPEPMVRFLSKTILKNSQLIKLDQPVPVLLPPNLAAAAGVGVTTPLLATTALAPSPPLPPTPMTTTTPPTTTTTTTTTSTTTTTTTTPAPMTTTTSTTTPAAVAAETTTTATTFVQPNPMETNLLHSIATNTTFNATKAFILLQQQKQQLQLQQQQQQLELNAQQLQPQNEESNNVPADGMPRLVFNIDEVVAQPSEQTHNSNATNRTTTATTITGIDTNANEMQRAYVEYIPTHEQSVAMPPQHTPSSVKQTADNAAGDEDDDDEDEGNDEEVNDSDDENDAKLNFVNEDEPTQVVLSKLDSSAAAELSLIVPEEPPENHP